MALGGLRRLRIIVLGRWFTHIVDDLPLARSGPVLYASDGIMQEISLATKETTASTEQS